MKKSSNKKNREKHKTYRFFNVKPKQIQKLLAGFFITVVSGIVINLIFPPNSGSIINPADEITVINQITNQMHIDLFVMNSNNKNTHYFQGLSFYREGKYKQAVERFKKEIDNQIKNDNLNSIDSARCYYAMGNSYFYLNDFSNAIIQYTDALGILELLKNSGITASGNSNDILNEEDVKGDRNCITINNEISYIYYLRCISYLKCKDYRRACDDFDMIGIDVYMGTNEMISYSDKLCLEGDLLYSRGYNFSGKIRKLLFYQAVQQYNLAFNLCFVNSGDRGYKMLTKEEASIKKEKLAPVVKYYLIGPTCMLGLEVSEGNNLPMDGFPIEILIRSKSIAVTLTNRAKIQLELGYVDHAIEDCEAALVIYQDLSLEDNVNIYDTYCTLMCGYLIKGDIETSKKYIQIGFEQQKEWYGAESVQTARALENMTVPLILSKDYDTAIKYLTDAKRIFELNGMLKEAEREEKLIKILNGGGTFELLYNPVLDS